MARLLLIMTVCKEWSMPMKKRVIFSYVIFLAGLGFIYLIGAGCSSKISGQFYYDLNNNGSQDSNEPNAANIKVMIKKDGETVTEGFTAPDGTYAARVNGEKGKWCVANEVPDESMAAALGMSAPIASAPAVPADGAASPEQPPAGAEVAIGKSKAATIAGKTPTASADDATEQAADEKDDSKKDEPEDDTESADKDGGTAKKDEEKTPAPAQETETVSAEGRCVDKAKHFLKWETKPEGIRIDYAKAIADLGERIPKNCYAGQICEVAMANPFGCIIKSLDIGEYLSFTSPSVQAAPQGTAPAVKATEVGPQAEMPASGLRKNTFHLLVAANIPAGTTKVNIPIKIECPDGPHAPSPIVLNLKNEASVRVTPNLEEKGEESKMTITVENTGKAPIEDGSLTVTLSANMKITQMSNGCSAVASTMQCHGIKIGAGQTATREFIALTILIDSETSNSADIIFTSKDKGIEEIVPQISWISEAQIQEIKAAEDAVKATEEPVEEEPVEE